MNNKYPFLINVFFNNESPRNFKLAEFLYKFFFKDFEDPFGRSLNIPVKRYSHVPKDIDEVLSPAINTANVFLLDTKMILHQDWKKFSRDLYKVIKSKKSDSHRIYVMALSSGGNNFIPGLQIFPMMDKLKRLPQLITITLAEKIHLQLNRIRFPERSSDYSIKIFLSHAKKDDNEYSLDLRQHIQNKIDGVESFYDAHDIKPGYVSEEEIERGIKESILLVMNTDAYSSREWCCKEVLMAKRLQRPIIVIDRLKVSESRSFPYLGNVRRVRYPMDEEDKDLGLDLIVMEAVGEALRICYFRYSTSLMHNATSMKHKEVFSHPPELLSISNKSNNQSEIIMYPDPPLGSVEISVLEAINDSVLYVTPSLSPLLSEKGTLHKLNKLKIAISLSETDDLVSNSVKRDSIRNMITELMRFILLSGVQIVYSGNITYNKSFNYFHLLVDLVKTYRFMYKSEENLDIKPILNYSYFPLYTQIADDIKVKYQDHISFVDVLPPQKLKVDRKHAEEILRTNSFSSQYVISQSLSEMRNTFADESDAQVILGGKCTGFSGRMPGILEEFLTGLKKKNPIFLIGGFGGMAGAIIEVLQGEKTYKISNDFYEQTDPDHLIFLQKYNSYSLTDASEKVNYSDISIMLSSLEKEDDFGLNNGLSRIENLRLFNSTNELEIIHLILKGLKTL